MLTIGIVVAVQGLIPWAQDRSAKQDIAAVRTAESVALGRESRYFDHSELVAKAWLSGDGDVVIGTNDTGSCWLSLARSGTGATFYSTDKMSDASIYDSSLGGAGCLTEAQATSLSGSLDLLVTSAPTGTPTPEPSASPTPEALNPGEPADPPANSTGVDVTIRQATYPGWDTYFSPRNLSEMTSTAQKFAFSITGASDATRYDVAWSSASMNTINAKAPTTSALQWWNGSPTWHADVTAGPEGYTVGTGYLVATATDKNTGEQSVYTWKITVAANAITQSTDGNYSSSAYWLDKSVPETSTSPAIFAWSIKGATHSEWEMSVTGAEGLNSTAVVLTASSYQYFQGHANWRVEVRPLSQGFEVGSANLQLTAKHLPTGTTLTKPWKLTVNPITVTQSTDGNYSSSAYWLDKSVPETSTSPAIFAWSIKNANASDWEITVTGADALNSTAAILTASSYQYFQGHTNWRVEIRPPSQGFTAGSTDILMSAKHKPSGKVITKTWKLTVDPITITQSKDPNYTHSSYWLDKSVAAGSTSSTIFAWSLKGAAAADWTMVVTGAEALNATSIIHTASSYQYWQGYTNWRTEIKPNASGFTAGTADITVTATHGPSGKVITKTWKLTVP